MKFSISRSFEKSLKLFLSSDSDSFAQIQAALMKIGNNYDSSGLNFEKINDFYSFRVNRDIRIIATLFHDALTCVYVDHHNKAYEWCERNKVINTTANGYIGFCDADTYSSVGTSSVTTYNYLLDYGFDENFIKMLNSVNEDNVRNIVAFLAPEYQELILNKGSICCGISDGYASDVIVINDDKELEIALNKPFEDWMLYLHPLQKKIINHPFNTSLLISGGPGTGKSVALVWRYIKHYQSVNANDCKPIFFCRAHTSAKIIKEMVKKVDDSIVPDILTQDDFEILLGKNSKYFQKKCCGIYIDEGQDFTEHTLNSLISTATKNTIPISFCIDTNQRIWSNTNTDRIKAILNSFFEAQITLNYCYRSTEQIINRALSSLECSICTDYEMVCPVVGNEIQQKYFDTIDDTINFIKNDLELHHIKSDTKKWGIIVLNGDVKNNIRYLTQQFRGHVFQALSCKGMEFMYGYTLTFNDETKNKDITWQMRKYVGYSRFRDYFYDISIKSNSELFKTLGDIDEFEM